MGDDMKDENETKQYFFSLNSGSVSGSGGVPRRRDDAREPWEVRQDIVDIGSRAGTEETYGPGTPVQPGKVFSLKLLPGVPGLSGDLWSEG